jgi:hypothetical protein
LLTTGCRQNLTRGLNPQQALLAPFYDSAPISVQKRSDGCQLQTFDVIS